MKYRKQEDGSYQGTTWQIKFNLDDVEASNIYRLRLALASANISELQVWNLTKLFCVISHYGCLI